MDGDAYNQPLWIEVVGANNLIVPVDGDAYNQRYPVGMLRANNLIAPVDGNAYNQRYPIRMLAAINHIVPVYGYAYHQQLPIGMGHADLIVPVDGDAYNQRHPIGMLRANNLIVPVDGDAYNQRLPIGMLPAINHNVPMDGDAYHQRLPIANGPAENHSVPPLADRLERLMSQLESDYTNHTKYIIKCLYIYVPFQAAVLNTAFNVPQKNEGCETWRWCPLILSSLASIAMIALYIQYVVQQFGLLKRGRQLQKRRDLLVVTFPQNWRLRLFSTNGSRTVFQEATNCWWTAQRITFLLMLISSSVFLSLFCTHLLC